VENEKKPEGEGGTPPPAEAPKYVTEEQLDSLLTSRFRATEARVEKTITQTVAQSLDGFMGKLKTDIAALLPAPKPEPKPEPAKKEKDPGVADLELKKLQEQIATLTQQAEQARSERDSERAKVRDSTLRQKLGEALAAAGIDGLRARHAIGVLVDAEKRVRWLDDGDAIVFRAGDRDEVDLESGVRTWLKTDDAKLYLPPKGTQGSGDRPVGTGPSQTTTNGPPDRKAAAEGLRRALLGQL
jgi:hypothetical protein